MLLFQLSQLETGAGVGYDEHIRHTLEQVKGEKSNAIKGGGGEKSKRGECGEGRYITLIITLYELKIRSGL